ncbi:unnamed protein product, partial [Rhizoctonia solani]
HGRDNQLHFWRLTPAAPLLADAANTPNLSTPMLASSMDVNALNYCRFSLYPIQLDPPRALLALPNLIESELIDVWELPGKTRLHAAVGTIKGAPPRKPFSDEGRDIYKTGKYLQNCNVTSHFPDRNIHAHLCCLRKRSSHALDPLVIGKPKIYRGKRLDECLEYEESPGSSCDNIMAVSVSADNLICRYDLSPELDADSAQLAPHKTKYLGNGAVGFRPDGRVLGVAGWDGAIRLYSTGLRRVSGAGTSVAVDRNRKIRDLGTLEHFKESCFAMAFANEVFEDTVNPRSMEDGNKTSLEALKARSRWLVVGGKTGRVAIWELDSFEKR